MLLLFVFFIIDKTTVFIFETSIFVIFNQKILFLRIGDLYYVTRITICDQCVIFRHHIPINQLSYLLYVLENIFQLPAAAPHPVSRYRIWSSIHLRCYGLCYGVCYIVTPTTFKTQFLCTEQIQLNKQHTNRKPNAPYRLNRKRKVTIEWHYKRYF